MVEQIPAAVAYPAFRDAVLPWASEAGLLGLDAEALDRVNHFFIELGAAIKDQVTGRRVEWKCLAQLLDNPSACRVFGDIAVQDSPPIMRNDEEAVQNAESECRNGEEVHCGNRLTMVAQERRPPFCRLGIARRFSHPAQHGSLGNIEAEHFQLSVNARRAPGRILGDHTEDEFPQFPTDALSSHAVSIPRKPRPVELESCPMPANDGLRLDEGQCPLPSRPQLPQDYPEQLVGYSKSRLRAPLFQNGKLLPKCKVFHEKVAARAAKPNKKSEQELQRTEHQPVVAEASRISMQAYSTEAAKTRSICALFIGLRLLCMVYGVIR
jgi:hypothetical protein